VRETADYPRAVANGPANHDGENGIRRRNFLRSASGGKGVRGRRHQKTQGFPERLEESHRKVTVDGVPVGPPLGRAGAVRVEKKKDLERHSCRSCVCARANKASPTVGGGGGSENAVVRKRYSSKWFDDRGAIQCESRKETRSPVASLYP